MNTKDWDTRDIYTDASGRMRARILCWSKDVVTMQRWMKKSPNRKTRFTIPERAFLSPSCGWRIESRHGAEAAT